MSKFLREEPKELAYLAQARNEPPAQTPRSLGKDEKEVRQLRIKNKSLTNQIDQLKKEVAKWKTIAADVKTNAVLTSALKQDQDSTKKRKFKYRTQIAKDVKSPPTKPSIETKGFGLLLTGPIDSDDEDNTEIEEARGKKEHAYFA
jgi:hypothetical protein